MAMMFVAAYLAMICYCHPDVVSYLSRRAMASCKQLILQLVAAIKGALAIKPYNRRQGLKPCLSDRSLKGEKNLEIKVHFIECASMREFHPYDEPCLTPLWDQRIKVDDFCGGDLEKQQRQKQQQQQRSGTSESATQRKSRHSSKIDEEVVKLQRSSRIQWLRYPSFRRLRSNSRQQ